MYTPSERLADGTMHILGIAGSIAATTLLIIYAAKTQSGLDVAAVSIYGGFAILTFVVSALYHMTPWSRVRPLLQRIDHAAIYLKIAGTYTPLVVILGSVSAYILLGLIWSIAVMCAVGKLTERLKPGFVSTAVYASLGWASLLLIWPLMQAVPVAALWLMLAGGVVYTLGALINHWESLRFNVAIWHGFVISGSGLFFAAIVLSLAGQVA
ncbi:MAG: hemolysin III family protein [Pseudomonadota bacterium]